MVEIWFCPVVSDNWPSSHSSGSNRTLGFLALCGRPGGVGGCPLTGGGGGVGIIIGFGGEIRSVGSGKVSGGGGCTGVGRSGTGLESSSCDSMGGSTGLSDMGIE